MLEPSTIVLYVDDLTITSLFYQNLLGLKPMELSETFHEIKLTNGFNIGLKIKSNEASNNNRNSELAFTLDNKEQVDQLFAKCQSRNCVIAEAPTAAMYGYTFVALDPNGHHLRFVALGR